MSSSAIAFTAGQAQAIHTLDRSLIVSAAAGSGKTAVLAERCAYLVCDAPEPHRCDADALLVLTFTDAAAAEMRSRIIESIRRRAAASSADPRLRRQLALVDAAQISTLHSFCLWMIRRWFTELEIDPSAMITDEHEAKLLKTEVLDELFRNLYAPAIDPNDPLGGRDLTRPAHTPPLTQGGRGGGVDSPPLTKGGPGGVSFDPRTWILGTRTIDALSPYFNRLVDTYGLGEDAPLAAFIRRIQAFTVSLPDPHLWLTDCVHRLTSPDDPVLHETAAALAVELERQTDFCAQSAARIETGPEVGHFYATKVRDYEANLRRWRETLGESPGPSLFEQVRQAILAYQFDPKRAPTLKDAAQRELRQTVSEWFSKTKKNLHAERLQDRFARCSIDEIRESLACTAPDVAALVDLVARFDAEYSRAKRRLNVLDFADLERFALQLLRDPDRPGEPSDIARSLHTRFAHVLVDEFQDINPLQQEILRLVSRESTRGDDGNLFVVGDVKQSIYRFRLAEPALFTERVERFRRGDQALFLQDNFRSRPEILDGINVLFRRLMRPDLGPTVYDAQAELRPGKPDEAPQDARPIELHLLEKPGRSSDRDDAPENPVGDGNSPVDWSNIEREAYLIAQSIHDLRRESPLPYRDIAVLLRTVRGSAERVATVLTRQGIPAFADVGGSLFEAMEVRDVLSALEVMDNLQQDIPLVGVLRGGVFGERFSEDELVDIRCVDRKIAFHEAVRRRAAQKDEHDELGGRVRHLLDTIGRYRDDARRQPLAEVLWRLYDEQAYLAYACGLPNGPQRRANLLKLHALARQFGGFRRQGLHRFLRFIRAMADEEQDLSVAATLGESEDVVRIMSIHQSKGLEFPVVFVAGLGTRFNLRDRSGRMLSERKAHLGLRIVDLAGGVELPTAAHHLVVDEIERTTREEDMRILYVAMTRAKNRLILMGSTEDAGQSPLVTKGGTGGGPSEVRSSKFKVQCELTAFEIATAKTPLEWLVSTLAVEPGAPFEVHAHTLDEMMSWFLDRSDDAGDVALRTAVSHGDPLPADEPITESDPEVERVLRRRGATYPYAAATATPATLAASELGRAKFHETGRTKLQETGRAKFHFAQENAKSEFPSVPWSLRPPVPLHRTSNLELRTFMAPPSKYAPVTDSAAQRGTITHRVLQHLDFTLATTPQTVASELRRLVQAGVLAADEIDNVDQSALGWFVTTELAARIRGCGPRFHRELRFLATQPASALDPAVGDDPTDRVLVRGIVDAILEDVDCLEVIDYKTDAVSEAQVPERAEDYRPTLALYSSAVERMWKKPVRSCSLVFLTPRRIVECAAAPCAAAL